MVKASASRAEDPGFESRLRRDFSGSSQTSDSALQWLPCQAPGGLGSALGLVGPVSVYCEVESLICNFCLSVAARKIVRADPSLRYTGMFAGTLNNHPTHAKHGAVRSVGIMEAC